MSTFLVSLGVVVAAVVGVVLIALADPDQPATNRQHSRREGRARRRIAALLAPPPSDVGTPAPAPPSDVGTPALAPGPERAPGPEPVVAVRPLAEAPVLETAEREAPGHQTAVKEAPLRQAPVRQARRPVREHRRPVREARKPATGWLRLRSGMALVVLVTFVGLVLAALVGTTLALAAEALRRAVG